MILLHITDVGDKTSNGVAVAVANYVKYEEKNCKVAIYNLSDYVGEEDSIKFSFSEYPTISSLPSQFNKPDLVIFNEVYKPKYIKLYKECINNNIKYIIIPHGCLVNKSQKRKRIKKIAGNILLFNKFVSNANAIQFLNENEKNGSKFKYKKSIIAGNGVTCSTYRNSSSNKNKEFVFIGRYEIKHKGLDLLVKVCSKYHDWFIDNNIKIKMYGRDSGNDLRKLKRMIYNEKVNDIIIINNAIYNDDKRKVLENAYAFIQCSRFEGQPMGIIEALSIGVPCVVTYGTYLGDYIESKKCGIACNFDVDEIFEAIKKVSDDQEYRNDLSANAYNNANVDFEWKNVIDETIEQYRMIIGDESDN